MKRFRKTRFQQLHLIITVIAALIITAICLVLNTGLFYLAVWVSATIVLFYMLGQVIRLYLSSVLKPPAPEAEEILVGEETDGIMADEAGVYSNAYAEFDEDSR
jgi:hypothetical protein